MGLQKEWDLYLIYKLTKFTPYGQELFAPKREVEILSHYSEHLTQLLCQIIMN